MPHIFTRFDIRVCICGQCECLQFANTLVCISIAITKSPSKVLQTKAKCHPIHEVASCLYSDSIWIVSIRNDAWKMSNAIKIIGILFFPSKWMLNCSEVWFGNSLRHTCSCSWMPEWVTLSRQTFLLKSEQQAERAGELFNCRESSGRVSRNKQVRDVFGFILNWRRWNRNAKSIPFHVWRSSRANINVNSVWCTIKSSMRWLPTQLHIELL